MRIIRAYYHDDGEDEACFTEAIPLGSLVEESIEMFCAQTSSGAESLTPSSLFYFQGLNFRLFAFPEKSFPIL